MDRLADLSTDILDKTREFVRAMPYRADSYNQRHAVDARSPHRRRRSVTPKAAAFLDIARVFLG
jgi:hypothetical protein